MRTQQDDAPSPGGEASRIDLMPASACALAAFLLYSLTACRTIFVGDSAELAAAASCFGVPHPPGYPLYTLLTALWVRLFPDSLRALAANLASSLHGALAVGLLFLLARRSGLARGAAFVAAAVLALGRSTWAQAVAAEVYAFDLLLLVAAALTCARAMGRTRFRDLLLAGVLVGLWLGHRFLNLAYLPALWWIARGTAQMGGSAGALGSRPARASRPVRLARSSLRRALPAAIGLALSALVYLYLPLASLAEPRIDIGDPETPARLLSVVRGAPYLRHLEGTTAALAGGRLLEHLRALPLEAGFGLVLAALGLAAAARPRGRHRALARGAVLLFGTNLLVVAAYNILDIASYRPPGVLGLAILAAIGVDLLWRRLQPSSRACRTSATAALAALACLGLPLNYRANDLHRENAARRLGEGILRSAPPDALLLTEGDTVTHVLWYLQSVERRSPDLLVVSTGHAAPWYFDQLARRRPGEGIPVYREGDAPAAVYRRLLEETGRQRPVAFTFSPNRLVALTAGPWWEERGIVPVGLALEAMRRTPPFDRDSLAAANIALWRELRANLPRVSPAADFETQVIGFEYALAMVRTAEFLDRSGREEEARDLYGAVLRLEPDRWERHIASAYRRIGKTNPELALEARARRALAREPEGTRMKP